MAAFDLLCAVDRAGCLNQVAVPAGVRRHIEDLMSSSPGSHASAPRTALFALAVGAALIGVSLILLVFGINVIEEGEEFIGGLYPPIAVTTEGAEIRNLYTVIFLMAVAIFLVVEGLIIWSIIRYRRRPTDTELPPQIHGNNVAEIVWTVVPTLIVIFMFIVSWQTLNSVDTTSATTETKIRAVAGQFQWQFDYLGPDGKEVLYTELLPLVSQGGGMYVPAGRPVQLQLVSNDVIHAFYVPQFLFKRDVVPGRTNSFEFTVSAADAGQTFRGQCAELCGTGHSIMLFEVKALTGPEFDSWLADKVAEANATPAPPPSVEPGASGPAPSGAGGGGGPGEVVQISAKNVMYEQSAITATADAPFQIDFKNEDPGTPHNVAIHLGSPTGEQVFMGKIFNGVADMTYDVPALPAGTYAFVCSVHSSMTGTLTVQ
jgi:cytochrome c oxidase subunit II